MDNFEENNTTIGYDLKETRNRYVAKENTLIQKSRYCLSDVENKAVCYLISKIQPDDEPGKIYIFNCREFQQLLKWKNNSYNYLKTTLQRIGDASIWVLLEINGRPKDVLLRWFDIVRMDRGTGDIEISFQSDMFPFLLHLRNNMDEKKFITLFKLHYITLMKHKYSQRLYELLKSYQVNNKKWTFENGTRTEFDLQIRIGDHSVDSRTRKPVVEIPDSWSNWAVFRRDVLEPAVKEINKYTDIKVAYAGKKETLNHRKTRSISTIEFYMVGKTNTELAITEERIDKEYEEIENANRYHQYTIEELFLKKHEHLVEIEKNNEDQKKYEEEEKRLEETGRPNVTAALEKRGLTEEQINAIYRAALNLPSCPDDSDYWDCFAIDVIQPYIRKIEATPEDTKTTFFKRLLDLVEHDYDDEASKSMFGRR